MDKEKVGRPKGRTSGEDWSRRDGETHEYKLRKKPLTKGDTRQSKVDQGGLGEVVDSQVVESQD